MAKHLHLVLGLDSGEVEHLALPAEAGGAVGENAVTFDATCAAENLVGDPVALLGASLGGKAHVGQPDIDSADIARARVVGVIAHKYTDTDALVLASGTLDSVFEFLTPGNMLYPQPSGRLAHRAPWPTTGPRFLQEVAIALTESQILVNPKLPIRMFP